MYKFQGDRWGNPDTANAPYAPTTRMRYNIWTTGWGRNANQYSVWPTPSHRYAPTRV